MNRPLPIPGDLRTGSTPAWIRVRTAVRRIGEGGSLHLREPGAQTASWHLPADALSVPRARRLIRARLTVWELDGFCDVVELLVSELVTNALRHAPGPCRLCLSLVDGLLRCEVEDTGTELLRKRDHHTWDEFGRGLHLIEMLACCWGSARTSMGKSVWFELPTGTPARV